MGYAVSENVEVPLEAATCPCGSQAEAREAFRTPTRRYARCPSCGLVYRNPRPDTVRVQAFYRDEYDSTYGHAEASADRQPVFESIARHLARFARPPGRLLDIGCGDGQFLLGCRERGWTCFGIELSQQAAARAASRGLTMLPVVWLTQPVGRKDITRRFNAITLINVLETVPDPLALLTLARSWLTPDGSLVVRVANGAFHLAVRRPVKMLGGQYHQAFHLFVYSPRALTALLRRAGFDVVSIRNSRPSRAMVHARTRSVARWLWFMGGQLLWWGAEVLSWLSGRRLVCAPSFELIAKPQGGAQ